MSFKVFINIHIEIFRCAKKAKQVVAGGEYGHGD